MDDWWAQAACRGADPDLFIPERGDSADEARAICHDCPVWLPCLAEALTTRAVGVWGGTTGIERRWLRMTVNARVPSHGVDGYRDGCRCNSCRLSRARTHHPSRPPEPGHNLLTGPHHPQILND